MKSKSRNVAKGKRLEDGTIEWRDWRLSPEQGKLLNLYNLDSTSPTIGSGSARGPLKIGPEIKNNGSTERESVLATYTRDNIANHFGFYDIAFNFFDEVIRHGINIPDVITVGAAIQVQNIFYERMLGKARRHMENKGIDGVTCWFYVSPVVEAYSNDNGEIDFKYAKEWPLAIVPHSPDQAVKKWGIGKDLLIELSLTAGWLTHDLLPRLNKAPNENARLQYFGGWIDCLPEPKKEILAYLKKKAAKSRWAQRSEESFS